MRAGMPALQKELHPLAPSSESSSKKGESFYRFFQSS